MVTSAPTLAEMSAETEDVTVLKIVITVLSMPMPQMLAVLPASFPDAVIVSLILVSNVMRALPLLLPTNADPTVPCPDAVMVLLMLSTVKFVITEPPTVIIPKLDAQPLVPSILADLATLVLALPICPKL